MGQSLILCKPQILTAQMLLKFLLKPLQAMLPSACLSIRCLLLKPIRVISMSPKLRTAANVRYNPCTHLQRISHAVRVPFFHEKLTVSPLAVLIPFTYPLAHAFGTAGKNSVLPLWLCTSISQIAEQIPKLPSI